MNDKAIRKALLAWLADADADAIIHEELPIHRGDGRADCVRVGTAIHGYEIKSEQDSLARLPSQILKYDDVFEFCTIVLTRKHLAAAQRMLPKHWGIFLAESRENNVSLRAIRVARRNPRLDGQSQIRLLTAREIGAILRRTHKLTGRHLIADLWRTAETLSPNEVCDSVRRALKLRLRPQSVLPYVQCGD